MSNAIPTRLKIYSSDLSTIRIIFADLYSGHVADHVIAMTHITTVEIGSWRTARNFEVLTRSRKDAAFVASYLRNQFKRAFWTETDDADSVVDPPVWGIPAGAERRRRIGIEAWR